MEEGSSNVITIASIIQCKESRIDIHDNLEAQSECCIYKVPKDLRKINEEAYTSQVISIGPLHYNNKELIDMEKQKIRYQREFAKRIKMEAWQELVTFIEKQEQYIRNCYKEMPIFEKDEFIAMILYDAIFIIELIWRFMEEKNDFWLDERLNAAIRTDLQLLENQLPYSVLEGLFDIAFPETKIEEHGYSFFFLLSWMFFYDHMFRGIPDNGEVKHFVDLRRKAITRMLPKSHSTINKDIPASAFKLQESGVKFTRFEMRELLDVKFEKKKGRIPWLQDHGELQIPQIIVDDWTERLIRNVMALEQCHYPLETHVCNYISLMDHLINTKEDVDLLVEAGVISNHVGDTTRLANMFNNLCLQIYLSHSCYRDIANKLNSHYEDGWNHTIATLKRVYFSNYWRGTGTIAAIVLLLLTLIQTVCSILQVV